MIRLRNEKGMITSRMGRACLVVLLAGGLGIAAAWPARGATLEEQVQLCAACHGENGVPIQPDIPIISGQNEGYLYLQLRDMKRGSRVVEQMAPFLDSIERDDMLALAAFFSKKPWPALQQPRAPDAIIRQAMTASGSIGCRGCHLANYQGTGSVPRLAGQQREYLDKTTMDFRTRRRANNPGMSGLMSVASEADLRALAQYLAGL
jgi:cytochrome c553